MPCFVVAVVRNSVAVWPFFKVGTRHKDSGHTSRRGKPKGKVQSEPLQNRTSKSQLNLSEEGSIAASNNRCPWAQFENPCFSVLLCLLSFTTSFWNT